MLMSSIITPTGERRAEQQQTGTAAVREFVKGLSLAELETIALEVLSEALQTINPKNEPELAMKLANATLDRSRGKPGQQITMDANLNVVTVNASISFIPAARDNLIQGVVDNVQVIDNE